MTRNGDASWPFRYLSGNLFLAYYDVTPDGQRFVMVHLGDGDSERSQLNVVLNWFEELKQRVPVQ